MSTYLKNIPCEELPRERLVKFGAKNLTNEELLSILFRTGTLNIPVTDLSKRVLSLCSNVRDLRYLTVNKLNTIKGLGNVKSITLLAALELGKRVYEKHEINNTIILNSAEKIYNYFSKYIASAKQENFLVIYVNNQNIYINHKILFKGTLNKSIAHPREIFRGAMLESAAKVIIMHNHPSGSLVPSKSDDETTNSIAMTANIIGIPLLDHLIVSENGYFSYIESGRLKYE